MQYTYYTLAQSGREFYKKTRKYIIRLPRSVSQRLWWCMMAKRIMRSFVRSFTRSFNRSSKFTFTSTQGEAEWHSLKLLPRAHSYKEPRQRLKTDLAVVNAIVLSNGFALRFQSMEIRALKITTPSKERKMDEKCIVPNTCHCMKL